MLMRSLLAAALLTTAPALAQTPAAPADSSPRAPTVAAVIDACQADLRSLCGEEPFAADALSHCVRRNRDRVSPECQTVFPGTPEPSRPARTTDLRAAGRAMRLACAADLRSFCDGKRGRERGACLRDNREKLSSGCQDALGDLRNARQAQRRGGNRQDRDENGEF